MSTQAAGNTADVSTPAGLGEDEVAADTTAKLTVSVSFADGEAAYNAGKYGDAKAIFECYIDQRPCPKGGRGGREVRGGAPGSHKGSSVNLRQR